MAGKAAADNSSITEARVNRPSSPGRGAEKFKSLEFQMTTFERVALTEFQQEIFEMQ